MAVKYFDEWGEDDQEDFAQACKRHGRQADEFIPTIDTSYVDAGGIKAIVGEATVSYNDQTAVYPIEHAKPHWTAAFERDLEAGRFR